MPKLFRFCKNKDVRCFGCVACLPMTSWSKIKGTLITSPKLTCFRFFLNILSSSLKNRLSWIKRTSGSSENQESLTVFVFLLQISQLVPLRISEWLYEFKADWILSLTGRGIIVRGASSAILSVLHSLHVSLTQWVVVMDFLKTAEVPLKLSKMWESTSGTSCSLFGEKVLPVDLLITEASCAENGLGVMDCGLLIKSKAEYFRTTQ